MGAFCRQWQTVDGVFHLELTGGGSDEDGHHYLTKDNLAELRRELSEIRKLAGLSKKLPRRGLITSSSKGGSFCDGIDYVSLRASPGESLAKELSDGMAAVTKELMLMPMPTVCAATGNAWSLGLALALAHDDLVVLGGGTYKLGMVEDGVAVEPHVAALVREKTDRWYTLTTLKSRSRSGNWMKGWYFADAAADSPESVLREAERLVAEWGGTDGEVHAAMRRQLYCESWNAACAIVPDIGELAI